ncbi:MAG: hypothetical protein Q9220_004824 [cf. Caloplaca sp. 1 TL-2023]
MIRPLLLASFGFLVTLFPTVTTTPTRAIPRGTQDIFKQTTCWCNPYKEISRISIREYYNAEIDKSFTITSDCVVRFSEDYCRPHKRKQFQCEQWQPDPGEGQPGHHIQWNRLCYVTNNEWNTVFKDNLGAAFGFNGITRLLGPGGAQVTRTLTLNEAYDACAPVCQDRAGGPPAAFSYDDHKRLVSNIQIFDQFENIGTCDGCAPEHQPWQYVDVGPPNGPYEPPGLQPPYEYGPDEYGPDKPPPPAPF